MSAQIALVPLATENLPAAIVDIDRSLLEEIDELKRSRDHAHACQARWNGTVVATQVPSPAHDAVSKLVKDVIREVLRFADETLSQPGAPLRCNADAWLDEHFHVRVSRIHRRAPRDVDGFDDADAHWETFRAPALWQHLVEAYSPSRVVDEARQRSAAAIISVFSLRNRSEIKRVSGRVELLIRRYSEKEFSGTKRRYSSHCYLERYLMSEHFSVFQVAAGLEESPVDFPGLGRALERTCDYDFRFDSRDRLDFTGGLSVVFFHSEIKVYLPDTIGAALNVFLSTYGAEVLRDR